MRYVAQILGAIIYSVPFTVILIILSIFPFFWILNASTFWLIVLFIFWGLVQAAVAYILILLMFPYMPLLKDNGVAFFISIGILVVFSIIELVRLWKDLVGEGLWAVIICLLITGAVIRNVFAGIGGMVTCYEGQA